MLPYEITCFLLNLRLYCMYHLHYTKSFHPKWAANLREVSFDRFFVYIYAFGNANCFVSRLQQFRIASTS